VISLQPLAPSALSLVAAFLLPLAFLFARRRTLLLMRRARWLLLSIAVLFALATPGQRLPGMAGDLGVTQVGLLLATEHVLRLILLLASLAVMHERLGTAGMMAGLYWLLAPLSLWRTLRERIVVRLMLVLDYVENASGGNWRDWLRTDVSGPESLSLSVASMRWADWLVLLLVSTLVTMLGGVA
jgi:hypothetical protein